MADVIGKMQCENRACGATVEVRKDRAGKLYYFCDGRADPHRICNRHTKFGPGEAATFMESVKAAANDDTRQPANDPAADPAPKRSGGTFFDD